jgi:hypothetical protein
MTVDVYKPPEVFLPESIQSIAILNRTGGMQNQEIDSIMDGVFSGEGDYTTYLGAQQAVLGAIDNLEYSEEYAKIEQINLNFVEPSLGDMPDPIDWILIEEIAARTQAGVVIVLEYFEHVNYTDFTTYMQKKRESKNQIWTNRIVYNLQTTEKFVAQLKVFASAGWRLYYPKERIILDTYVTRDSLLWEADGRYLEEAEANLPNKSRAVEETGFFMGENYVTRIISGWETVQRQFYKPILNKEFKGLSKYLKMRRWGELEDRWKAATQSSNEKSRGKAHYNLAVLYEMDGDISAALQQAQLAAKLYPSKTTIGYFNLLEARQLSSNDID